MRQRVGSIDVAHKAGVSRATVSYVLNGRKDVTIPEETRKRVWTAARELGYRPNRIAASLAEGRTRTIGIVVPRLDSSFQSGVVYGIQQEAARRGFRTLIVNSLYDQGIEDEQIRNLLDHRVEGIVTLPSAPFHSDQNGWLSAVEAAGAACVLADAPAQGADIDCVVSANHLGAAEAVRYLISLGHRRIGYLQGFAHASSAIERYAGYRAALAEAEIPFDPGLVAGDSWDRTRTVSAAEALLDRPDRPTALFACNDALAAVALKVARRLHLQVPGDLALVGFGDLEFADFIGLTTVRQSPEAMGRSAAELLFNRFEAPDAPPVMLIQPTELVIRETSGGAR